MKNYESTLDLFKKVMSRIGLDLPNTKFEVSQNAHDYGQSINLAVVFELKNDLPEIASSSHPFMRKIIGLQELVRDSELVKEELRSLEGKLQEVKEDLAKSQAEIERLNKFETYYNMQYDMNHGKEETQVKK